MKFTILSVLLSLLFTLPASGQWQLAPVTGLNISKIRFSDNIPDRAYYFNSNGFMVGLNTKYTFENQFNLQLEGAFSQKGTEYRVKNEPGRDILNLNYIDFGLIAEYPINNIISVNAGGNYGINVGGKINGSDGLVAEVYDGKDIGVLGGLKFYIGKVFIRTNYYHGLNPVTRLIITDENGLTISDKANEYNQVFQVSVGYYFL